MEPEARTNRAKTREVIAWGSISETNIGRNDQFGRLLGTVTGVLNGASTVFITSPPPKVASCDVLTTAGDVLIATGAPTRTPVPGEAGEFISHVELTVVGRFGKYAEATGAMTFDGRSHTGTVPPTTDLVYQGTCVGRMSKAAGTKPCCGGTPVATVDTAGSPATRVLLAKDPRALLAPPSPGKEAGARSAACATPSHLTRRLIVAARQQARLCLRTSCSSWLRSLECVAVRPGARRFCPRHPDERYQSPPNRRPPAQT